MSFTVNDALKVGWLREAQVCGGAAGLTRIVSSVNVMEVPDILAWIKPRSVAMSVANVVVPATTASKTASRTRAYSSMSCPDSSRCNCAINRASRMETSPLKGSWMDESPASNWRG